MATEVATNRIKRELHRLLDNKCTDLDRIEILAAAIDAFSQPIPDYAPDFCRLTSKSHERVEPIRRNR